MSCQPVAPGDASRRACSRSSSASRSSSHACGSRRRCHAAAIERWTSPRSTTGGREAASATSWLSSSWGRPRQGDEQVGLGGEEGLDVGRLADGQRLLPTIGQEPVGGREVGVVLGRLEPVGAEQRAPQRVAPEHLEPVPAAGAPRGPVPDGDVVPTDPDGHVASVAVVAREPRAAPGGSCSGRVTNSPWRGMSGHVATTNSPPYTSSSETTSTPASASDVSSSASSPGRSQRRFEPSGPPRRGRL